MTTGNTTDTWFNPGTTTTTTTPNYYYRTTINDIGSFRPFCGPSELRTIELKVGTKTIKISLTGSLMRCDEDFLSMGMDLSVIADSATIEVCDGNGVARPASEEELMEFLGQRPE